MEKMKEFWELDDEPVLLFLLVLLWLWGLGNSPGSSGAGLGLADGFEAPFVVELWDWDEGFGLGLALSILESGFWFVVEFSDN